MIPEKYKFRGEFLLFSLVLFFVATPLIENVQAGEFVMVLIIYVTLVSATMQLSGQRALFVTAMPLAAASMILLMASHFIASHSLLIVNNIVLTLFLALVSGGLFSYLGRPEPMSSSRLYVSVSLYFILGLSWASLYRLIENVHSGSFAENGIVLQGKIQMSTMLYFSLSTLTTLGFGDVVAVTPFARMMAALEAAAGILYIAITVARLVSAYQKSPGGE